MHNNTTRDRATNNRTISIRTLAISLFLAFAAFAVVAADGTIGTAADIAGKCYAVGDTVTISDGSVAAVLGDGIATLNGSTITMKHAGFTLLKDAGETLRSTTRPARPTPRSRPGRSRIPTARRSSRLSSHAAPSRTRSAAGSSLRPMISRCVCSTAAAGRLSSSGSPPSPICQAWSS